MSRSPTITTTTGKALSVERERLGISVRAVSKHLRVSHTALYRWEADLTPLDPERAARWRHALSLAAADRAVELQRRGISLADLRSTDLGELLTSYSALSSTWRRTSPMRTGVAR